MANSYRVEWEMDTEAESPREAAENAWRLMRTEGSIANVFTVIQVPTDISVEVDLNEPEEEEETPYNPEDDSVDQAENWARHPRREQRDRRD